MEGGGQFDDRGADLYPNISYRVSIKRIWYTP